jgi:hypothetical protein
MKTKLLIAFLLLGIALIPAADAQQIDAFLGFGAPHDQSTGQRFNTFGDGTLYPSSGLGGAFADLGVNALLTHRVGIGADISWRGSQETYAGIHYRPVFYNFDGIFQPSRASTSRFVSELRLGIGGASLRFNSDEQQNCVNGPACDDHRHFQVHFGFTPKFYLSQHWFLRPAIDVHYVHNFTEYGSNWAPQYSLGAGYSFGREIGKE